MKRRVGALLVAASLGHVALGHVARVRAQDEFSAEPLESSDTLDEGGSARLGLWGPVFSSVTAKSDSGGVQVENRSSSFGLPAQGAGLGIGYAPNRIVGFGVDVSAASQDNELLLDGMSQGRLMVSTWMLSPFLEVSFSERATVRPLIRGQLGFGGTSFFASTIRRKQAPKA